MPIKILWFTREVDIIMPSRALQAIVDDIEARQTDPFGKFYMYATLLKVVAMRKESFTDALPKQGSFWGSTKNELQLGLCGKLSTEIDKYKTDFDIQAPNLVVVVKKIVLAYFRQGQLSDLSYILEKMLSHLQDISQSRVSVNQSIYKGISFEDSRQQIQNLLSKVNSITLDAHACVDNGIHATLSGIAAVIGLMAALTSTLSFFGVLLALAMAVGGAFGAYVFIQKAMVCIENMEKASEECSQLGQEIFNKTPQATIIKTDQENYKQFILSAVLAPLAYTTVTVKEQLAPDSDVYDAIQHERQNLDLMSSRG